jgi:hypothetical protein
MMGWGEAISKLVLAPFRGVGGQKTGKNQGVGVRQSI